MSPIETILFWVDFIIVFLLVMYGTLGILYWVLKPNIDPNNCDVTMQTLRPVPIPTKEQSSFIHRITVFIFEVRKWEVVEDWHYKYAADNNVELVIPKGFIFDGTSIPRPFWAILNPIGLLLIQGLMHDYAYKYDTLWQINVDGQLSPYHKRAGKEFPDYP